MKLRIRSLPILLCLGLSAPLAAQDRAEEQYRFLAGLVEKGMHEMAVQEAQRFLREHPDHARAALARYRLAGALWELERRDEAAREYEALARLEGFEYRAESLFRAGEAARVRGDEKRARAAFEGVLAADQAYLHAPARFALGELAFAARRFEEAEQHYAELLRQQPAPEEAPLARRALVWCAWERGDAPEAARRARAFLEEERDPARADELRTVLGEALLEQGDAKAALAAFRAIRTPEQQDARARGEGFALAALGDHAGAAKAFEGLLANTPKSPHASEARLQAGIERLRAGDAPGARAALEQAAAGGEPEALYWLAQSQKEAGDLKAALATLERALRAKPANDLAQRIQVLRGDCFSADGRPAEARRAYEQSGSQNALHAAAVAALNQGDTAEAVRLAERLEDSGASGQVLGEAYFAARRYPDAERVFAALLEAGPDEAAAARARSRLAWCRYLGGDLATAAQRFGELGQRHPAAPEAEEALAMQVRIAAETGDGEAARAAGARYLERYRDGRFLDQALLALARAETGRAQRARYEELLKRCPQSPLAVGATLELAELESTAGEHERAAQRYSALLAGPEGNATVPEKARAAYGLAWCCWERGQAAECAQVLTPLARAAETPEELRTPVLELLLWADVRQKDLAGALVAWRQMARTSRDPARTWEAARALLAAQKEAGELEPAHALLDECARAFERSELAVAVQVEAAYLALDEHDLARAEKALAGAARQAARDPRVAEAAFHVGAAHAQAGDEERALELFAGAGAVENPRAGDALYQQGFVRLKRGELEPAAAALARLLERPDQGALALEARFLLGEIAFRAGDFEGAVERLGAVRSAAQGELLAKTLFRLGLALGRLQRWKESEAALSDLATRFPQFANLAEAELMRARALLAQQKYRPARAAVERVLALDQGDLAAAARLVLGQVHEADGRVEDALSEYLKVALLYAEEDAVCEALFRAGGALERLNDPKKAGERYRELVDEHPRSHFAAQARARLAELERP